MRARHANKRSKDQRLRDRVEIASSYLRGESQASIAARLNISRQEVSYDLQVVRREWQRSAMRDIEQHTAEELARLDELERTYWQAWERSLQPLEHTVSEQVADQINVPAGKRHTRVPAPRSRTRSATRTEAQCGNPAYLAGIERIIEQRCRILGLLAPTNVHVQGSLSFDELWQLA